MGCNPDDSSATTTRIYSHSPSATRFAVIPIICMDAWWWNPSRTCYLSVRCHLEPVLTIPMIPWYSLFQVVVWIPGRKLPLLLVTKFLFLAWFLFFSDWILTWWIFLRKVNIKFTWLRKHEKWVMIKWSQVLQEYISMFMVKWWNATTNIRWNGAIAVWYNS